VHVCVCVCVVYKCWEGHVAIEKFGTVTPQDQVGNQLGQRATQDITQDNLH